MMFSKREGQRSAGGPFARQRQGMLANQEASFLWIDCEHKVHPA